MEMTDVQNNAVEPWLEELHGLSYQNDLEPFQDWEGQEKGEVLGKGSKVEQITRVKGRLEQKPQIWKEDLASLFVIGCIEEGCPCCVNHLSIGMLIKDQQRFMRYLLQKQ